MNRRDLQCRSCGLPYDLVSQGERGAQATGERVAIGLKCSQAGDRVSTCEHSARP